MLLGDRCTIILTRYDKKYTEAKHLIFILIKPFGVRNLTTDCPESQARDYLNLARLRIKNVIESTSATLYSGAAAFRLGA